MKLLDSQNFVQGRWRNGQGISWEIATDPEGSGDSGFQWRMALAQIDASVGFSDYENTERIFTLVSGDGLDLILENGDHLHVAKCFVPYAFPGDVETRCVLHGGPCRALNVFFDRRKLKAEITVVEITEPKVLNPRNATVAFALRGAFLLDGTMQVKCGDAFRLAAGDRVEVSPSEELSLLYLASFKRL